MVKFSNNLKTRSRRNFVQSTVGALAAIPLASTGFKNDAKSQEEKQTSPIIVGGGGSVGIDFRASAYQGDPKVGTFTSPNDTLHKLWLIDKYGGLDNITPTGGEKCTITILCRRRRRHQTTIVIEGDPLKVQFDPREFRYDYPPEGSKKVYHNTKHKIIDISVYDKVSHQTQHHTPPTKGKCTLVVVDTY